MRTPQIDLAAILTQQNPQIDLRLNAYEKSTRHFLKSVTSFKNRAITIINDRRNTQAAEMKRVMEKTQSVEGDTKACKIKEIEVLKGMCAIRDIEISAHAIGAEIEKEQEERRDAELALAAFKRQLATLKEKSAAIDGDIEQYRAMTANLRHGEWYFIPTQAFLHRKIQKRIKKIRPLFLALRVPPPSSMHAKNHFDASSKALKRIDFWFASLILPNSISSASSVLCWMFQIGCIKVGH
jgi:hypothetical protein